MIDSTDGAAAPKALKPLKVEWVTLPCDASATPNAVVGRALGAVELSPIEGFVGARKPNEVGALRDTSTADPAALKWNPEEPMLPAKPCGAAVST